MKTKPAKTLPLHELQARFKENRKKGYFVGNALKKSFDNA